MCTGSLCISSPSCLFFFVSFPTESSPSHAPQCAPDNLFLPSDILNFQAGFFFPELEFLTSLLISPPPPPSGPWMIFDFPSVSPQHPAPLLSVKAGLADSRSTAGRAPACPGSRKVSSSAKRGVTRGKTKHPTLMALVMPTQLLGCAAPTQPCLGSCKQRLSAPCVPVQHLARVRDAERPQPPCSQPGTLAT